MAIGDPLSKNFRYQQIEDDVRLATGGIADDFLTPQMMLDEISLSCLKVGNMLAGISGRFYGQKDATLTITGSANPYTVDLSGENPFPIRISRVVHVTTGGVRTFASPLDSVEAQTQLLMNTVNSSGLFYVDMGDSLEIWAGSGFTITTASDKIHIYFYRQPNVNSVTRSSYVDVLDVFVPFVIQDMVNKITSYFKKQPIDPALDTELHNAVSAVGKSIQEGA